MAWITAEDSEEDVRQMVKEKISEFLESLENIKEGEEIDPHIWYWKKELKNWE